MAKKTKSNPEAAWAKAFTKALQDSGSRPTGEGWFTLQEVGKREGLSQDQVRRRFFAIRKTHEVEMFDGCVVRGKTRVRQVWWRIVA